MKAYELNHIENSRSIDFVQGAFSLAKYPEESRALESFLRISVNWQIPHLTMNHGRWL